MPLNTIITQGACAIAIVAASATASAQLTSVDEAVALSRKTGRPIFALAGNKT